MTYLGLHFSLSYGCMIRPWRGKQLIESSHHSINFSSLLATHSQLDSCSIHPNFSIERFALFTVIFLAMALGSGLFFIFFNYPFGIQLTSAVFYTSAVVLYTFSSNRSLPGYFFSCPRVRNQIPRLTLWHVGFLISLFILQKAALGILPHLPNSWLPAMADGISPFAMPLFIVSLCLALIQIFLNRRVLGLVHKESVAT